MATTYRTGESSSSLVAATRVVRPLRSVHHVVPGETLGSIAARYGLQPNELIQLNSHTLGATNVPHAGMRLQVLP